MILPHADTIKQYKLLRYLATVEHVVLSDFVVDLVAPDKIRLTDRHGESLEFSFNEKYKGADKP